MPLVSNQLYSTTFQSRGGFRAGERTPVRCPLGKGAPVRGDRWFARLDHGRCRRGAAARALGLIALLGCAAPALAREVSVPLSLDLRFMRELLVQQVYYDPGETARVWDDGRGCNELVLSNPQVSADAGRLRIVSSGAARIGVALAGRCLSLKSWNGTIEVFEKPRLNPQQPIINFVVVDSNVYGEGGEKEVTGTIWDWVKGFVHPRLEALQVDLQGALVELKGALPLFLGRQDVAAVERLVDSVTLADAAVTEAGVTVNLRMDVGEAAPQPGASPAPEPTFTEEELAQWEQTWQSWDAFLTFVVKRAGGEAGTDTLRRELGSVLLDARYEFLQALRESRYGAPDRVRVFFLHAWSRLAPLLRDLSGGLPGESALHYLSFIAAGDALAAMDAVGPQVGVEISTDGLRRLARMMAPDAVEDPVAYSFDVDPVLRQVLGFGPPLPLPEPEALAPTPEALWFFASPVWAEQLRALRRWVPTRDEVGEYIVQMHEVLTENAMVSPQVKRIQGAYLKVYQALVMAAAWQESCWRQFVEKGGRIEPMRSVIGSVGMMQINEKVWRGVYDINALRNDVAYNVRAGSEILVHYLVDYAIAKHEDEVTGNVDNLARATYSAYNAGPGQLRRYRTKKKSRLAGHIDEAFWVKYQAVKAGKEMEVASCFGVDAPAQ
jgi:hypothetical protein